MCLYEFLVKISLAAGKWANSGGASHSDQAPKAAFHDTGRNRQVSGCLHGIYNSRASLGTPARPSSFQSLLTFSGSKLNVAVQLNSTNDICRVLRKTHCVYALFTGFPRPHLLRQAVHNRGCANNSAHNPILYAHFSLAGSFSFFSPAGVQLILGLNGVIWVSAETTPSPEAPKPSMESDAQPPTVRNVSQAERHAIARVANCIRALAKLFFSIHPTSILSVYMVCTTCYLP